jgi:DNA-binding GntR family transcriptional regulator
MNQPALDFGDEPFDDPVNPTYTVAELADALNASLRRGFSDGVWVRGEIQGWNERGQHAYFNLADDTAGVKAVLRVQFFANARMKLRPMLQKHRLRLVDGMKVRVFGYLDFYAPAGQLGLKMADLDPRFTLGDLAAKRDDIIRRLVAEGLLTFRPNRGFDVRQFEQQEIFDLYELRRYIEVAAVRLAVRRAPDAEIAALRGFWGDVLVRAADTDNEALLGLDEEFHIRLAGLSGNREMARSLQLINAKIRFVRWVEMEERRTETYDEHGVILARLADRDEAGCERELGAHIERRLEEITTAVHAGVVRLYAR